MSAICRTCGGEVPNHKPSPLDPNGMTHPGHRVLSSNEFRVIAGTPHKEVERLHAGILALTEEPKRSTWEEKIESLVKLAKVVGRYVNAESGTEYCVEAYNKLEEVYEEFCQWRHDEPYVVDEIKKLLRERQ